MIVNNITKINRYWLKKTLNYWLPPTCICCHLPSNTAYDLCLTCHKLLPWLPKACTQCAMPLSTTTERFLCGRCLITPPTYHRCHSLFTYDKPITTFILAMKFKQQLRYSYVFGQLLAAMITSNWYYQQHLPEVIIPVPLHRQRIKQRGYNQAVEIAKSIAQTLLLPIDRTCCQRTKATLPQTGIDVAQRYHNLKGAFTITRKVHYQHVAIVDDVLTTGHTSNELALSLLAAGVSRIDVWCIARTCAK